jgi:hypothetical protein
LVRYPCKVTACYWCFLGSKGSWIFKINWIFVPRSEDCTLVTKGTRDRRIMNLSFSFSLLFRSCRTWLALKSTSLRGPHLGSSGGLQCPLQAALSRTRLSNLCGVAPSVTVRPWMVGFHVENDDCCETTRQDLMFGSAACWRVLQCRIDKTVSV